MATCLFTAFKYFPKTFGVRNTLYYITYDTLQFDQHCLVFTLNWILKNKHQHNICAGGCQCGSAVAESFRQEPDSLTLTLV